MSKIVCNNYSLDPADGEHVIVAPASCKLTSVTMYVENLGPGTASVKIMQSYFGNFYDDDFAQVTTVVVPPQQERSCSIDTGSKVWYQVKGSSSGGISKVRMCLEGTL